MFDKLIDWLIGIWDQLLPFTVVPYYKKAVRLRLGIPIEDLEPGLHWKIPFADETPDIVVKAKTINLSPQYVMSRDGVGLHVKGIIKYEVEDVRKALMEVNEPTDALSDMVLGIIRDKIADRDFSECNSQRLVSDISRSAKAEAKKWGLTIVEITLDSLIKISYVTWLDPKTTGSSISYNPPQNTPTQ